MERTIDSLIAKSTAFGDILESIRGGQLPCSVSGVTQNAKAYFAGALSEAAKKQVVFVATMEQSARQMAELTGGAFFPEDELTLRSVAARSRDAEMLRAGVLKNARAEKLVFMTARSFITRMMPPENFYGACISIKTGKQYNLEALQQNLVKSGYERAGTVYSKGEFAQRGGILDIFPADTHMPLRITFFDDEVETIRHFDADTQKSVGRQMAEYTLPPVREIVITDVEKEKLLRYLEKQDETHERVADDIRFELSEYGTFETADTFLAALYEPANVTDYFPDALFVFDDFERVEYEARRLVEEFDAEFARLKTEVFAVQKESYLSVKAVSDKILGQTINLAVGRTARLKTACEQDMDMRAAPGYQNRIDMLANNIKDRLEHGYSVYLFAGGKAQALSRALLEYDVNAPVLTGPAQPGVFVSEELVSYGFEVPSAHAILLGANDIFGRIKKQVKRAKSSAQEDIFSDLSAGDFVVHEVHGKGKYLGLKTLEAGGNVAEYMEIEYRGGDKLYIPTAQIDRVQKYIGSEDAQPQLSRLGGKEWENAKARARESALKLAFDLVELYAQRFDNKGYAFSKDTVWQKQFEDAFEYEETEGQTQSIEEIKRDMESTKVMDRLLLGDVGYGKTEVAMRAAMKAVMDGKQVAVLVPTTLLARQHEKTFQARFADFPVTIASLSRLTKAQHKKIIGDVARGKVDIVIGTHRLLSDDVSFNDLGLLIVDEEQRFGVSHKEKIKLFKQSVDVLTLSATPIPRTLEMAMTGIRDLSTIDTPPAMRKTPYSYVMRYSEGLLRDAVMRELSRGGQLYFVCRQIREMEKLLRDVKNNVPEARVAAAHGQMGERELEDVVAKFIDGEYDVLVCTTIIESGIDIPSVNTVIVYEADKFGLSQLYQLKGRVGRADSSSYAYFTYLGEDRMNENAAKRLAAIREFTQLGSGFKIAMRDLQIRGAGNLLGPEQSGHMATIGYAMYCKVMKDAVDMAKGKQPEAEFETAVELNVPAYIPDSYIRNQSDKMDIYRLISKIKSISDAKETSGEIADRYGKIPKEVNNLVVAAVIKSYAARAGLASVIKKPETVELKYAENVAVNVKKLLKLCDTKENDVILRASTPPVLVYSLNGKTDTKELLAFLKELGRCKRSGGSV
ncbi:MAG: transcription-repair coupling factor [Christensenellaceae bacterium]